MARWRGRGGGGLKPGKRWPWKELHSREERSRRMEKLRYAPGLMGVEGGEKERKDGSSPTGGVEGFSILEISE